METITQAVFQDEDTELERLKANIYVTRAFFTPFHEYIKKSESCGIRTGSQILEKDENTRRSKGSYVHLWGLTESPC